ncbi:MAG: CRISPR-associated helicase Cas3', partial [Anaerolineae bacterium]
AVRGGPRWGQRHEVLSLAFVDWFGGLPEERVWLAAVVATHHRSASALQELYPLGLSPEDEPFLDLASELDGQVVEGLWRWLTELGANWIDTLGMSKAVGAAPELPAREKALPFEPEQAAQSIRRWLRRCYQFIDGLEEEQAEALRIGSTLLRGYLLQSDHTASAHAQPLRPCVLRRGSILTAAGVVGQQLYSHQEEASATNGSALLIAPTGSGKTEAALLWASRQAVQRRGSVPRLFYILPYQASMNAMYDRLQKVFPKSVGLLHGRSTLALYRRMMEEDAIAEQAARKARWLADMVRLNVPPVRVTSPYQMLKAAYRLKGYEALLADYAQATFIFDEIHAYEPRRLAMILEMVRYLRETLGAAFFVMTATLPAPIRRRVEGALGEPSVIHASEELYRSFSRHQVLLLPGDLLDGANLDAIVRCFSEGRSVLVTCTTVRRAQDAYDELVSRLPGLPPERIVLIHGAFCSRDRLAKEHRIQAAVGLGERRREPVLVVSTQVVEVSLNIDLDVLFSDPAPLEALLQRFGRINRKRRVDLAPVHVFRLPDDGQHVYDARLVQATLAVLAEEADGFPVDESAVQRWLDAIYQGQVLTEWEEVYAAAADEFCAAFVATLRPFAPDCGLEEQFNRLFDGVEVLPACLVDEYRRLDDERPLEAAEFLVPISWHRHRQLQQEKRVVSGPGAWPAVVNVAYTAELGLSRE